MKAVSLTLAALALATGPLLAQRIGDPDAPKISQSIQLGDMATVKLGYASINWAAAGWSEGLKGPQKNAIRQRINRAAEPLGSFSTDAPVTVGGQAIPAGDYKLAFKINADFGWQLVLGGTDTVSWDLELADSATDHRRLGIVLGAGDEDFTANIRIAFGKQECNIAVYPVVAEKEARPEGIINTLCPLMEQVVVPEFYVEHDGYKIGMCCLDCIPEWANLTDLDKDEILKELLKNG